MSRNEREDHTVRATDEEILAYISRNERPVQTARSIGEQFGFDRSQAYRRLQQLADEGVLEKTKVGGRAVVWWIADKTDHTESDPHQVNPNDPIFTRGTFEAGEPDDTSKKIDEILYGDGASESA